MILEGSPEAREEYQLGTTKVFMREGFEQHLERLRRRVETDAVIKIQKNVSSTCTYRHCSEFAKRSISVITATFAKERIFLISLY